MDKEKIVGNFWTTSIATTNPYFSQTSSWFMKNIWWHSENIGYFMLFVNSSEKIVHYKYIQRFVSSSISCIALKYSWTAQFFFLLTKVSLELSSNNNSFRSVFVSFSPQVYLYITNLRRIYRFSAWFSLNRITWKGIGKTPRTQRLISR